VLGLIIIASKRPNFFKSSPLWRFRRFTQEAQLSKGMGQALKILPTQQTLTDLSRKGRDEEGLGKNWENSDGAGPSKKCLSAP
jgi:hypothetical protein